ncbi:D-arabinono-1,4-lactone oxidase [Cryobacterium tepidiphilum]|uniref:FAD-binding protein n=1 Tax=Cryobacterium tepidiphilum TaxID=2486026 RepID=A0A3M8LQX9_9MICO|nr:D-arabinono-1,4-lactone oxidase [Cryobacterium tepidiphilum]RNE66908.1 FAD-binding protein [Cryobacterium tepidiphilum]
MTTDAGTNWSGNLAYAAAELHSPQSVDELRRLVASSGKVRALGTRHSFNRIADTEHTLVSTAAIVDEPVIDRDAQTVSVAAGMRYGELAGVLERAGFALATLASLPHISVGGATATATHGSGVRTGNLSTAVTALDLVLANGDLLALDRDHPDFAGAVVHLGALGIVTRFTLAIEPSFGIEQTVFERLPWESLAAGFDEIMGSAYSVSLFTTWQEPGVIEQVWVKRRPDRDAPLPAELAGAMRATEARHPLPGSSAVTCTPQLGVPGRWLDRLPHFRLEFTPSNGEELQSEYLVPRQHAVAALEAVRTLADRIAPLLFVTEVRTVAADDLWLSPSHERDAVCLHFTWHPRQPEVEALLPDLEAALAPFSPRPHWGKLFAAGDLAGRYPKAADFRALAGRLDPQRTFVNEFVERHILPEP